MNEAKAQRMPLKCLGPRIAALAFAVAVAFSLAATAPLSAYAAEGSLNFNLDKTASALDENNQSNVNLEFTGSTDKTYSDVVFVFDKSTSVDVREAAINMVDELLTRAGDNKIKVGVVVFNSTASSIYELTELNTDTVGAIKEALQAAPSSGTNIDAGLQAGKAMLDGDSDVAASAKHLVLVTDGVTYLYGTGAPQSIYSESASNGEESINAGNDLSASFKSPITKLDSTGTWFNEHASEIEEAINTYSHVYVSGQYKADESGNQYESTYANSGFNEGDYVPGKLAEEGYPTANDAAVYKAMVAWKSIVGAGYNAYAFASDKYVDSFPWAAKYISTLSDLGGESGMVPSNTAGMFDAVKSEILYALGEGSVVTDVMGSGTTDKGESYNFDFVNDLNKISITVDGVALQGYQTGENTYAFGTADDQNQFELTYDQATDAITLDINIPIAGNDVLVSYYVDLVQAPTKAGEYQLNTNNSAVLDPAGDTLEPAEFPKPTVKYVTEEAEEPVVPVDPGNNNNNTNNNVNTGTVNVNTDSDGKATSLPKTSDNVLPFAAGLIALIALAGSAGAVAWRKTH